MRTRKGVYGREWVGGQHTREMAEAEVFDEVRALSALALTSVTGWGHITLGVGRQVGNRCSPAPGPPRTNKTVTLLWSNAEDVVGADWVVGEGLLEWDPRWRA